MSSKDCNMMTNEDDGDSRVTLKMSDYEHDRVLRYSDINNLKIGGFTIKHPGVIDLAAEETELMDDSEPNVQKARKEDPLGKEKHSKSRNRIQNVDFKKNTGLVGIRISQKDIIVDDIKEVPKLDVYERIIGKAYDNAKTYGKLLRVDTVNSASSNSNTVSLRNVSNLSGSVNSASKTSFQTCQNPSEVNVCKITDSKLQNSEFKSKICNKGTDNQVPRRVAPKLRVAVSILKKRRNTICSTYLSKTEKASTVTMASGKNVSNLNACVNNVNKSSFKTCHNPLEVKACKITDSQRPENVCSYDHITEIKSKISNKSNDVQATHRKAPQVAESISGKRRNTIASTYFTNTVKASTHTVESVKNVSNLNARVNNVNRTSLQTCHNPLGVSVCEITDTTSPINVCNFETEIKRKIGSKSTDNQVIYHVAPKAASISNKRRNTISSTYLTNNEKASTVMAAGVDDEITKDKSEKVLQMKIKSGASQVINQVAPKVAAPITKKRRDTVPATYPENTSSVKICDKSSFRDDQTIPHSLCQTIPVLLNKEPYPDQKSSNNFSPIFLIPSVVHNRQSQEFLTENYLQHREFQIASPRPPQIRPRRASYCSPYNYYSQRLPNNQYPIFNRLMNAGTFARNSPSCSALSPTLRNSEHLISLPYRPNSIYLPSNISITSPKYTQPVVNIKQVKETINNKVTNPAIQQISAIENTVSRQENNESVKNVEIPKYSLSENKNILNNVNKINSTEQSFTEKNCNMTQTAPKKEYSPPILPILSYSNILNIIENSEYNYPLLKTLGYNRSNWINPDTSSEPDLDKNKRKAKISISEYKKRICSHNQCK